MPQLLHSPSAAEGTCLIETYGSLRVLRVLDALAMALPVSAVHWVEIQAGCGKGSLCHLLSFMRKFACFCGKSLFSCGHRFITTFL